MLRKKRWKCGSSQPRVAAKIYLLFNLVLQLIILTASLNRSKSQMKSVSVGFDMRLSLCKTDNVKCTDTPAQKQMVSSMPLMKSYLWYVHQITVSFRDNSLVLLAFHVSSAHGRPYVSLEAFSV